MDKFIVFTLSKQRLSLTLIMAPRTKYKPELVAGPSKTGGPLREKDTKQVLFFSSVTAADLTAVSLL